MKNLFKNFLKGCLVIVPAGVTIWLIWSFALWIRRWIHDEAGWLTWPIFVLVFLSIAVLGAFTSNAIGKRLFGLFDWLLTKVPLVNFLYTTLRDVMRALVGESAAFEHPVIVSLSAAADAPKMLGFVTCEDLAEFGAQDHVAVYFPQSYNFAGNLLAFPRDQVKRVDVDRGKFMSFLLSGGVVQNDASATSVATSGRS